MLCGGGSGGRRPPARRLSPANKAFPAHLASTCRPATVPYAPRAIYPVPARPLRVGKLPRRSSAKAALENLARSLALEYALSGIHVNVVSPGNVAAGSSLKVFDEDPAPYREFVLRVSLGRRNSPESIADAFVFPCSPLASEINGQILSPDYGAGIGNRL